MEDNKPIFLQLARREQKSTVEVLIFASDEAIPMNVLYKILIKGGEETANKIPFQNIDDINELSKNELINNQNELNQLLIAESSIEENITKVGLEEFIDTNPLEEIHTSTIEKKELDIRNYNDFSCYITEIIDEINQELTETNRPFKIINVAGGFQYSTKSEFGELLQLIYKSKSKRRLSHASLECLAIIAYKQPISKPEIEQVRGINSNEVVNSLLEKNLIEIVGRKDVLGKPLIYGTTNEFLRMFGLKGLSDLPKLRELEEITMESLADENIIEIIAEPDKLESVKDINVDEYIEST